MPAAKEHAQSEAGEHPGQPLLTSFTEAERG